jgi:hypothetical protein
MPETTTQKCVSLENALNITTVQHQALLNKDDKRISPSTLNIQRRTSNDELLR